jgi:hypothetical protein
MLQCTGTQHKNNKKNLKILPGTVAQICYPSYSRDGDKEDQGSRPAWAKNVLEILSQPMAGHWWHVSVSQAK